MKKRKFGSVVAVALPCLSEAMEKIILAEFHKREGRPEAAAALLHEAAAAAARVSGELVPLMLALVEC